ncbi:MAG: NADH-quinone oxidoreductase subunit N [Betaproteobacteria bacterium]|nr:NADH-quinone oxidoreductase subunit N [Betaproteobacteria bacterium]
MTLAELSFKLPDLLPAGAEIFLLTMACAILLIDLFVKDKERTPTFALTQFTLVVCAAFTVWLSSGDATPTQTFSGMYVADFFGAFLKLTLYIVVCVVLFYARTYMLERAPAAKGEFYSLALFATLGMMVMISANHFLVIYLGLEILSLSLYAMVALQRDSVRATEAAMKYFILGALASGLLLYGMSMIYGATGTLDITRVANALGGHGTGHLLTQTGLTKTIHDAAISANAAAGGNKMVLILGLVFLVAGLGFKLGVVPFHMWIPDVYHGAPTGVTLFIGTAPKLAAFAVVMRLLVGGLATLAGDWQQMLIILAVLSLAIGNLAAIAQTNIKRMLAYSTISHMGFMLLGLVSAVGAGVDDAAIKAYSASMFYVITYVLTSAGAFGMILLLSRSGFESEELDDFKGLNKRSPWFAAIMMILMFSMAGIPFFVGFFAKFAVLQAVVEAGRVWLAVLAVVFSLIGAFYYLRVIKLMYFDPPEDATPIEVPGEIRLLISLNALAVALFGIFPQQLMAMCFTTLQLSL